MEKIFGLKRHGNGWSWGRYDVFTNKTRYYSTNANGEGLFDVTEDTKQILGTTQFKTSLVASSARQQINKFHNKDMVTL